MRIRKALTMLALAALLAGCSASPGADPAETVGSLAEQLSEIPGVLPVEPGLMAITVDLAAEATDEQVMDAAERTAELAAAADYSGTIDLARANPGGVGDSIVDRVWSLRVHPADSAEDPAALADLLTIERFGGVFRATVIAGWPYVTIASIDEFADRFHRIRELPLFENGGTYTLHSDEHLRVVHVPSRTSPEAIDAIIGIARDHPQAEVLLEAMTTGPQWPKLWVARLTPDEVTRIDERLRDPELADADVEGYPLEYQLTTVGDQGPVYTEGTFGGVPR